MTQSFSLDLRVRVAADLPLKFHPAAVRASAGDTPSGATGARGQRAEPVRCAA
jgi:hypothetical protein